MERVNGANWFDIGGGKRGFRSQNAGLGIPGTEVTDVWLNAIQEEVAKVIEDSGQVLNPADNTQLLKALRRRQAGGNADLPIKAFQSAPPGGPAEGDLYVVKPAGAGAWAGRDNNLAYYQAGAWVYQVPPINGLVVNYWSGTRLIMLFWTGAAWVEKAVSERAQDLNYVVAGGTANALTAVLDPAIASYAGLTTGFPLRVMITATNTAAATLALNGLAAKTITQLNGVAVLPGALRNGMIAELLWDGVGWLLTSTGFLPEPDINFRGYTTTNRNYSSGVTRVQYDAVMAGSHAGMQTGVNSRFVAPVAGWYLLFTSGFSASGPSYFGGGLRVNGSTIIASAIGIQTGPYTAGSFAAASLYPLAVNDYVEGYVSVGGTTQVNADAQTFLAGSILKAS